MKVCAVPGPKCRDLGHPFSCVIKQPRLEEAELLRAVTHQEVLGLLIVVEHHAVGFAADAGLLVSSKGSVCRISVVAVDPHASGLNAASQTMAAIDVSSPETGAEAVEGVVGDFERVGFVLECGNGDDGPEDF